MRRRWKKKSYKKKSYRKKTFKRRRFRKGGGVSKSLIKKILTLNNPPCFYRREVFGNYLVVPNTRHYFDISRTTTYTSAAVPGTLPFLSYPHIAEMAKVAINAGSTISTGNEYWMLKAGRYIEMTNICNVPMYFTIHKIYTKQDTQNLSVLELIRNVITRAVTNGNYANNGTTYPHFNEATAYTSATDANPVVDAGGSKAMYISNANAISASNFTMTKFSVLSSIFKDPMIKRILKRTIRVKSSKEFLLHPQQQISFGLKHSKPFKNSQDKWMPEYDLIPNTDYKSFQYQCLKNLTCHVIVEAVGMTAGHSDLHGVPAAGGNFAVSFRDTGKFARAENNKMLVNDAPSVFFRGADMGTEMSIDPTKIRAFGASNNTGATVATAYPTNI